MQATTRPRCSRGQLWRFEVRSATYALHTDCVPAKSPAQPRATMSCASDGAKAVYTRNALLPSRQARMGTRRPKRSLAMPTPSEPTNWPMLKLLMMRPKYMPWFCGVKPGICEK